MTEISGAPRFVNFVASTFCDKSVLEELVTIGLFYVFIDRKVQRYKIRAEIYPA
jgi:hypothetical protein